LNTDQSFGEHPATNQLVLTPTGVHIGRLFSVLVVQAAVGTEDATKAVAPFINTRELGIGFALVVVFLLFLTLLLLSRLARIPEEYRVSITLYERMR
jgi:hypothetical protein